MADFTMYLDMIIVACGVYLIYGAVILKTRGEITPNIMLPKNVTPEQVKDKEGFKNAICLKLFVLGIATVIVGLVIVINDVFLQMMIINAIAYGVFAAALLWYGFALKKAHKEYL